MGKEFKVDTLEDMCSLMCDNVIPEHRNAKSHYEYGEQKFEFDDDRLYRLTCVAPGTYRKECIITKDMFVKCYNEWIKGIEDDGK